MIDERLRKRRRKEMIYDRFHRFGVSVCMVATLCGTVMLGAFVYDYFANIRPARNLQTQYVNEELLSEGRVITEEN